jgi:undecaprenyl-diphosphatase
MCFYSLKRIGTSICSFIVHLYRGKNGETEGNMSLLFALFLGLIQGLTEFLPVSSSGHLSLLQNIFGMEDVQQTHLFFDTLLHLGTLISVCVYFRKEIRNMLAAAVNLISGKKTRPHTDLPDAANGELPFRLLILIVAASLPLIAVALIYKYAEVLFYNTAFIGFALCITGGILYISDKLLPGRKTEKSAKLKDALIVGLVQAIAVIPGLSRSGLTITAGIFRGFDRNFAVRFSFLLSVPAILGANIFGFIKAFQTQIDWSYMAFYLAGAAVASVSGYFAIKMVGWIMRKGKFGRFAYYCWIVGILALIASIFI